MLISHYTTFDDIRAALGTNVDELEDETLALGLYEDALVSDLEDVAMGIPAAYTALQSDPTPTDAESRFLRCARTFATYSVARHLTVSLPLFSPMRTEDGKAGMSRISDPYKETVAGIHREYDRWRNRLLQAYQEASSVSGTTFQRVYLTVVSPAEDPITGA